MLKKPTVLILGAGASVPYGFSTGKKQLDDARLLTAGELANRIAPLPRTLAPQITSALHYTGELSIDAMLPADSPLLPAAKALIARDLYRVEFTHFERAPELPAHWYRMLYTNIPRRSIEQVRNAPLRIFTFNYDRSLDRFLSRALAQSFPSASPEEIGSLLATIGPFHLHGQLGRLNPEAPGIGDVVPYGGSDGRSGGATDSDVVAAIGQIRLISETTANDAAFVHLHSDLSKAARVVFLGFAFHEDNVNKLKLPEVLRKDAESFASAYGLTVSEMAYLRQKYGISVIHGSMSDDIASFLANYPQILD